VSADRRYRVAVVPGDGIGREVIPAGLAVLEVATRAAGIRLETTGFPWGCDYYRHAGRMLDADGFDRLRDFDAIYFGAVGAPGVPDHVSVWELILPIRQRFEQYVNLRPMRLMPGVKGPLAGRGPADLDMLCVRENSEGEYSGAGGRLHVGTPQEVATETALFTRRGIERIVRFAFEAALRRPRQKLASATKSNALRYSMVLWDEVVAALSADYPQVSVQRYHVDALAARMITAPQTVDVIVGSNLFGDILTDLGAALTGSLGLAPGANVNPERRFPSMFEPIHGSAPDIAGQGVANPVGAVWAGAMMLDHLGEREAHDRVVAAIERVLAEGRVRTPDLGGTSTTEEMTSALRAALEA
jgi:tartrate dehydrogenase/decarboxylase / D-malate dehydrogenase